MQQHGQALRALGYQQITNLAAATALTVPAGAAYARIICTTQAVRWRDDGTDPTATIGMPLPVNTELCYDGANLSRVKFIEQAASAVLNITYYG
jgi:hypothetical protein